ncbi:hypothetical protein EDD63_12616 [Breznakia blatticola]|uniref:Uncharacterized protein n=1 Tax=Breznakia blatticola TaxID=1754012 RepID=A0A4R7ZG18_9FIRM|nr:hypothetical protein [Breznakia blatticola]TDW16252.1 hypothetical protein EDD63_12616 [Breznakia blatticola]
MKNIGEVLFRHVTATCVTFIIAYVFTTYYENNIGVSKFEWFGYLALFSGIIATATYIGQYIDKAKGKALVLFIVGCIILVKFGVFFVLVPMLLIESIVFIYSIFKLNMNTVLNSDEQRQIEQGKIDKMKIVILQNRRLCAYKILIALIDTGIIFSLSRIFNSVAIVALVLLFLSYYLYIGKIQGKNIQKTAKLLDDVLTVECDAKLYCVMYRAIERNCSSIAIMYNYMCGLQWGGYVIELDRMLKAYRTYSKTFQYKTMFYSRKAFDNKVSESLYTELIALYDRVIKRSKNDKMWIYGRKILVIQRKIIKQSYREALENIHELYEYEEILPKISLINQRSLESECLYHLGKYEECTNLLEWIIEHGNTLVVVRNAQDRKQRIHENLAIEV